jgi:hypothetical protein
MNFGSHDNASRPSDPGGQVSGGRPSAELADRDEARLRALFDETIEPATGPTLTKLAARAADVPERARRTPLWLPRWAWRPAAAGLVVAAGALGAAFAGTRVDAPSPPQPAAVEAHLAAPAPAAAVSADARDRRTAAPEPDLDVDESLELVLADGDWEGDVDDDDALDSVYGPPSDANLDAWLYATSAVLEGGG